jgi:molybdopterin molybdotransferase
MIRDSNSYLLSSLLKESCCEVADLGIARDDRSELETKFRAGFTADCLVTSGGVSAGHFDLVVGVLKDLGVDIYIQKVNIKPGMPMVFGMRNSVPVFGLPGNPVSSFVTFVQFVKPALRIMRGITGPGIPPRFRIRSSVAITKSDGKRHFIRGILDQNDGSLVVRVTGSQQSNLLSSLTLANCLIVLGEDIEKISPGDEVEVELL